MSAFAWTQRMIDLPIQFQMKNPKPEEKPPYLDWSVLKARTVQVLVVSAMFSGLGLYTPVILLVRRARFGPPYCW